MADDKTVPDSNITVEQERIFTALRNPKYDNFALYSCFVNGEPTSAIVAITRDGKDVLITPLFIAPTPTMKITSHEGKGLTDD